jgi:hypothetical protein
MSVEYKIKKKWHKKLTKIQDMLCQMAEELPITRGSAELWRDEISNLQAGLVRPTVMNSHKEKRKNVISLAACNPTLSMSAIARHYGYSESFVAKVFDECGKEIYAANRKVS